MVTLPPALREDGLWLSGALAPRDFQALEQRRKQAARLVRQRQCRLSFGGPGVGSQPHECVPLVPPIEEIGQGRL